MKRKIVKATDEHLKYLALNMRDCDKNEVYIASGMNPYDALVYSCNVSDECNIILIDGIPLAVYGKVTDDDNNAVVWLVGTNEINNNKKSFYHITLKQIKKYLKKHDVLYNYVYRENSTSINWLKKVGAIFDEPKPYGKFNQLFMYFEMR